MANFEQEHPAETAMAVRREMAKAALLRIVADMKQSEQAQVTVGQVSRVFDRQYHDLLYSLLIEMTAEHRVRFDPNRPAPNRVEIV